MKVHLNEGWKFKHKPYSILMFNSEIWHRKPRKENTFTIFILIHFFIFKTLQLTYLITFNLHSCFNSLMKIWKFNLFLNYIFKLKTLLTSYIKLIKFWKKIFWHEFFVWRIHILHFILSPSFKQFYVFERWTPLYIRTTNSCCWWHYDDRHKQKYQSMKLNDIP